MSGREKPTAEELAYIKQMVCDRGLVDAALDLGMNKTTLRDLAAGNFCRKWTLHKLRTGRKALEEKEGETYVE